MSASHRFLPYLNPIRPGVRFAGRFVLESVEGLANVDLHFRDEQSGSRVTMRLFSASHTSSHRLANARMKLVLNTDGNADARLDLLAEAVFSLVSRNTASLTDEALAVLLEPRQVDCRIGTVCPNRCLFCNDRFMKENREKPFEELIRRLAELRTQGYARIMLTGFEPTLRPDLPDIIAEAIRLGFEDVQCVTNGVRVRNESYLRSLLDAGLRTLILSIHSPDAELEDALSGRVGSFQEKAEVLALAPRLFGDRTTQARAGLFFRTNSVLTTPALHRVVALVERLDAAQSSLIAFNYPWVQSRDARGNTDYLTILPDYEAVCEAFSPLLARLRDPDDPLRLLNLPPCVNPEFESSRMTSKPVLVASPTTQTADETPEMELSCTMMDPDMTHPPVCEGCRLRGTCRGVARGYVTAHGDKGLRAL